MQSHAPGHRNSVAPAPRAHARARTKLAAAAAAAPSSPPPGVGARQQPSQLHYEKLSRHSTGKLNGSVLHQCCHTRTPAAAPQPHRTIARAIARPCTAPRSPMRVVNPNAFMRCRAQSHRVAAGRHALVGASFGPGRPTYVAITTNIAAHLQSYNAMGRRRPLSSEHFISSPALR